MAPNYGNADKVLSQATLTGETSNFLVRPLSPRDPAVFDTPFNSSI